MKIKKGDIVVCGNNKVYGHGIQIFTKHKTYTVSYISGGIIGVKSKSGRSYKFQKMFCAINYNYPTFETYFYKMDKHESRKYKLRNLL